MPHPYSATRRTGAQRRDAKSSDDRRLLSKKLFPGLEISVADTCQPQERRESSRRDSVERRH